MITRGLVGYVLVLLGGLVVSVLPDSSPAGRLPVLGTLRETMPGRILGLVVVVAGLGLAASAWLRLVRYADGAPGADQQRTVSLVRRATVLWCLPLLLAPPMFSRDGWSYAAQGEMTRRGLSPYEWAPSVLSGPIVEAVDPRWMDTLTPYGPLPLAYGAVAASLTQDPWLLVIAHRVLALLGLALLAHAVPRLAARAGLDGARASALVLPSPLLLGHGVAGLHNDLLMIGLAAAALVAAIEVGWLPAAAIGGAAAAVKLPGGLVCVGVVLTTLPLLATWVDRVRRMLAVAVVSGGTLVASGAVTGLGVGWVHALGVPGEVRTPFSLTTQLGQVASFGLHLVDLGHWGDHAVPAARLVGTILALAIAGRAVMAASTGVPAAAVRAVALVMTAVLVLSPVVHHWYLLWCVPLLAACHLSRRRSSVLLHVSWLVGLVAPLDSSLEGATAEILVSAVLIGGIALAHLRAHGGAPEVEARRAVAQAEGRTLAQAPAPHS